MDEIEDENDEIDYDKLSFIGINREKFNFNTFDTLLNFLLDIFNGKITLKKAEFKQRDLENKKIQEAIEIMQKKKKKKK